MNIPFPAQVLPQDPKDMEPSFVPSHSVKCAELTQVTATAGNPFPYFFPISTKSIGQKNPKRAVEKKSMGSFWSLPWRLMKFKWFLEQHKTYKDRNAYANIALHSNCILAKALNTTLIF